MTVQELIRALSDAPFENEVSFIVKPIHNEQPIYEICIMDSDNDVIIVSTVGWEM